jgi:hypothetical protein
MVEETKLLGRMGGVVFRCAAEFITVGKKYTSSYVAVNDGARMQF